MRNTVLTLSTIYTFKSNRSVWSNQLQRGKHILSYQLEGQYDHTFPFGEFAVSADHVFIINKDDTYTVRRVQMGSSICITFTSDSPVPTEMLDCTDNPQIRILFKKLLNYRNIDFDKNYYMALSVVYEIFATLEEKRNKRYYPPFKSVPFIEVRDYLINNFSNCNLNPKSIYLKYGMSDKYFRERFKEMFGSTPTQFLINLRLNESAKMLSLGVFSVGEVAEASGFSDVYYFSRLFKKKFNCSPSNFARLTDGC